MPRASRLLTPTRDQRRPAFARATAHGVAGAAAHGVLRALQRMACRARYSAWRGRRCSAAVPGWATHHSKVLLEVSRLLANLLRGDVDKSKVLQFGRWLVQRVGPMG
eukprot:366132-Chlamydomonas_euryale.AAC.2